MKFRRGIGNAGYIKSFLICFIPLCTVFGLLMTFLVWDGSSTRLKTVSDEQKFNLEKSLSELQEKIGNVVSDLLILSESLSLDATFDGTSSFARLGEEYVLFSQRRMVYDQIRFIDNDGKETVRVNYGGGVPYIVPGRDLQDKADRPYFRLVAGAPRGTVYISGIDLNRELGEIERPIKPVIRLSAPVFDRLGDHQGVIVLNLRATPLFDDVLAPLAAGHAQPFVLDQEGNWIRGGNREENWSMVLGDDPASIVDRFGEGWENIRLGLQSFQTENGLFTVQKLGVPDMFMMRDSSRSLSVLLSDDAEAGSRLNLYIGARVAPDVLDALLWPQRSMMVTISIAFIVLIAVGSAAFAWTRQRQLADSFDARLSSQVLKVSKNSVVVTDKAGIIKTVNPGFTAMTGYLPTEAVGQPLSFLRAARENTENLDDILMAARSNGIWEGEVRNRRKSGDFFYSNVVVSAIGNENGEAVSFVEMGVDISHHMENAKELWRLANHDALTGLPNRPLFEDRLEVACAHAEKEGHMIAVLYIDLDAFKPVNDRYGHEVGDVVLTTVGQRITNTVRHGDTVSRLGGDEFAIIVSDIKNPEEADWVSQKVTAAIQRKIETDGITIKISASIGISIFPNDSRDVATLFGFADSAMSQQKRTRKSIEEREQRTAH